MSGIEIIFSDGSLKVINFKVKEYALSVCKTGIAPVMRYFSGHRPLAGSATSRTASGLFLPVGVDRFPSVIALNNFKRISIFFLL